MSSDWSIYNQLSSYYSLLPTVLKAFPSVLDTGFFPQADNVSVPLTTIWACGHIYLKPPCLEMFLYVVIALFK